MSALDDATSELVARLKDSLATGTPYTPSFDELVAAAAPTTTPVVLVRLELAQPLTSLARAASILSGAPIMTAIPVGLPALGSLLDELLLRYVTFYAVPATRSIVGIECELDLGKRGKGETLTITRNLAVTFVGLRLRLGLPGQAGQTFFAEALGTVAIASGADQRTLEASLAFPALALALAAPEGESVSIAQLLTVLNVDASKPFDELQLLDVAIEVGLRDGAGSVGATIWYGKLAPETLWIVPDTLGISAMELQVAWSGAGVNVAIGGAFEVKLPGTPGPGLGLQVSAAHEPGTWSFTGGLDLATTRASWGLSGDGVSLADLAEHFLHTDRPQALAGLSVTALEFSYTYASGGDTSYELDGEVEGAWDLGPGLGPDLELRTAISFSLGTATQRVTCRFALDGLFELELGYDFNEKSVTMGIPALGLTGTYDARSQVATVTFNQGLDIETLLEWFVGEVSGDPGFRFPDPWADLLHALDIPANTSLTIGLASPSIEVSWPAKKSFFGNTIDEITLGYSKTKGPLFTLSGSFPLLELAGGGSGGSTVAWNPADASAAPTVPGLGRDYFDLQLVALGQRIAFPTPAPATVEAAMSTLTGALAGGSGDGGPNLPSGLVFDATSGWLLGIQATVLDQLVVEIIFNDPQMYGLMIEVVKARSGAGGRLDNFIGLFFEVLYRKVTDAIGEYYVALNLPAKYRVIKIGAVTITLPSFSLAIYTNGDFKLDLGFPNGTDFSDSAGVGLLIFSGRGGLYVGRLSGATADALPPFDSSKGNFHPVVELGVGLAIGVEKDIQSGPLSVKLSVLLEAIVEGVYAPYVAFATKQKDDYYKVKGLIGIVGRLTGTVNLAVITADLTVEIDATASFVLEAYRPTDVVLSASVDVSLRVKVGVGNFAFHVHVGFHKRISTHFAFGSSGHGAWQSSSVLADAVPARPLPSATPPVVRWQPIAAPKPVVLHGYLVPHLTVADASAPATPTYVAMLYLNDPQPAPAGQPPATYADETPSFDDFACGLLLWALHAYGNTDTSPTADLAAARARPVDGDGIAALRTYLEATLDAFTASDVAQLAGSYFALELAALPPATAGTTYGLAFFPLLSSMKLAYAQGDGATAASRPTRLGRDHLEHWGVSASVAARTADVDVCDQLLVELARLLCLVGLERASELFAPGAASPPATIGAVVDALAGTLAASGGFATRAMLHGLRVAPAAGAATLVPLYQLTGQSFDVVGTTATSSTLTLTITPGGDGWKVALPGGARTLVIDGKAGSLFQPPSAVASQLELDWSAGAVTAGELGIARTRPRPFTLGRARAWSIGADATPLLWSLPRGLVHLTVDAPLAGLALQHAMPADDGTVDLARATTIDPRDQTWATTIDLRLRRIRVVGGPVDAPPTYQTSAYELVGGDAAGVGRLTQLLSDHQAPLGAATFAIACAATGSDGQPRLRSGAGSDVTVSVVRTNLSTESRPANASFALRATAPDPLQQLLGVLWDGLITNSGGYYLHYADRKQPSGLDEIFSGDDAATVTLIVMFGQASTGVLPLASYMNAVVTTGLTPADREVVFATSPAITQTVSTIPPGSVGIEVIRPAPPEPTAASAAMSGGKIDYRPSLAHLYQLLTCEVASIGGRAAPAPARTTAIGPVDAVPNQTTDAGAPWTYRRVFPLCTALDGSSDATPPPGANPYAAIGQSVAFDAAWTDVFGHRVASPTVGLDPIVATYSDAVPGLGDLPGLTCTYRFAAGGSDGGAVLTVDLAFDRSAFVLDDGAPGPASPAKAREAYARMYYQLTGAGDRGAELSVTTSILAADAGGAPAKIVIDEGPLCADLAAVYGWLTALIAANAAGAPAPVAPPLSPLIVGHGFAASALADDLLYVLDVSLVIERQGPIHPGFSGEPSVARSRSALAPRPDPVTVGPASDADPLFTYRQFAADFESAFAVRSMRLATGVAWQGDGPAAGKQLWVVRFGSEGIAIAAARSVAYFAPRPLSNTLAPSGTFSVRSLDADLTLSATADRSVDASEADLDAQLKDFLSAIEHILSPARAVASSLASASAFARCLTAKQTLAGQLAGLVTDLVSGAAGPTGTGTPLAEAGERLRQECLISLSSFYEIDAIVVSTHPVTVASKDTTRAPALKLFGTPRPVPPVTPGAVTDTSSAPVTFTSTKGVLADGAMFAFAVRARQKGALAIYEAPLELPVGALEHDLTVVSDGTTDFVAGSWLRFVLPATPVCIARVTVPLPLRTFPAPPVLLGQSYRPVLDDAITEVDAVPLLAQAKQWTYEARYGHPFVAQDTVFCDVTINPRAAGLHAASAASTGVTLREALVEFEALWPALQAALDAGLASSSGEQPASASVSNALTSFATLVENVTHATWTGASLPHAALTASGPLPVLESTYSIVEGPDDGGALVSTVTAMPGAAAPIGVMPTISIPGYRTTTVSATSTQATYTFGDASGHPIGVEPAAGLKTRALQIGPLDIIDRQGGIASIRVVRNQALPPVFVYQTPYVPFPRAVEPHLDHDAAIDVSGLLGADAGSRDLEAYVQAMFAAVLAGSGDSVPQVGSLQILCSYLYRVRDLDVSANHGLPALALPVAMGMAVEQALSVDDPSLLAYLRSFAGRISAWATRNRPAHLMSTNQHDGAFRFDVTVFTSKQQGGQPFLRLRNLELPTSAIAFSSAPALV